MACSPKVSHVLPPIGEQAIPNIQLPDEPTPPLFSDAEFDAIPLTAQGKILKYKTDVDAYADIAMAAVEGYRKYLQSLFEKK